MPTGVYIRTEEQLALLKSYLAIAHKVSCKLPRTMKQIEHTRKMSLSNKGRHRTPAEIEAYQRSRTPAQIESGRKAGLMRKGKPNTHKGNVFADDTIEHHNDFCHGAERPDDITLMTHSEHSRMHAKLQYPNGLKLYGNRKKDNLGRFTK